MEKNINLIQMLHLNESIDQLAMTSSARWYEHAGKGEWSCLEQSKGL